jgi:hypothetical protein
VVNGINGETCTDWKSGDSELWCDFVQVNDSSHRNMRYYNLMIVKNENNYK